MLENQAPVSNAFCDVGLPVIMTVPPPLAVFNIIIFRLSPAGSEPMDWIVKYRTSTPADAGNLKDSIEPAQMALELLFWHRRQDDAK